MDHMTQQVRPEAASPPIERCRAGGPTTQDVDACVHQLAALARRVEEFVAGHLKKIELAYNRLEREAANYAQWEQKSRELRQQQADWEQKQAEQAQRVAEELETLTMAWDRLEAERRSLLADDDGRPRSENVTTAAPPREQPLPIPSASDPPPPAPLNFFDFEAGVTGRSAALQFQQIKREIRQHARRNRT